MNDYVTVEIGNRGSLVMIEPELVAGLTRRVFRRMPDDSLEFCTLADWRENNERARFYGYCMRELPASMRNE